MAFKLKYYDKHFLLNVPEIEKWICKNIPREEYIVPQRGKDALTDLTFPLFPAEPRKFKLNELYYPTGARWAEFYGLMSGPDAEDLILNENKTGSLVIKQDADRIVDTNMYLLPPIPLSTLDLSSNTEGRVDDPFGKGSLYLIRLVDERYFWQYRKCHFSFEECVTTWVDLLNNIKSALGISFTTPSISGVYGHPSIYSDLCYINSGANAGIVLEAVLYNIGCIIQRKLDGTYEIKKLLDLADEQGIDSGTDIQSDEKMRCGGKIKFDSLKFILPAECEVYYPYWWVPKAEWETDHPLHLRSPLSAIKYGRYVAPITGGHAGTVKTFRNTAKILNSPFGISNISKLNALTVKIAQDFLVRRFLAERDEVWNNIIKPTEINGFDYYWEFSATDCRTRIKTEYVECENLMHDFCEDESTSTSTTSTSTTTTSTSTTGTTTTSTTTTSTTSTSTTSTTTGTTTTGEPECIDSIGGINFADIPIAETMETTDWVLILKGDCLYKINPTDCSSSSTTTTTMEPWFLLEENWEELANKFFANEEKLTKEEFISILTQKVE